MTTSTEYLGLTLDDEDEFYDIEKVNANMRKIDAGYKEVDEKADGNLEEINGLKNPEFTEAQELSAIESGESISTIFGKLKKLTGAMLIGAGSTLLGQNLTAARALVSDVNGKIGASTITVAELQHLAGVSKNIQTQFGELNENMDIINPGKNKYYYPNDTFETAISNPASMVPYAFGHSAVLDAAGYGYWQNIFTYRYEGYIAQVLIGASGKSAVRYCMYENNNVYNTGWNNLVNEKTGFAYQSESITPNDYIDGISFRKSGNMVEMIFGRTTRDTGTPGTITLTTKIPEGFRPKAGEIRIMSASLEGVPVYVAVNTSGDIGIRFTKNIAAGTALYSAVTYIC